MSTLSDERKKKGFTQQELADKMGVSRSLIALAEGGFMRPYPKLKRDLAKALGVDVNTLFPQSANREENHGEILNT